MQAVALSNATIRQVEPATNCVADALARIGAMTSDFQWPSLHLARGEERVLCAPQDGLFRRTLATRELAELEEWLGVKVKAEAVNGLYECDVVTADSILLPERSRLILVGRPVLFVANEILFGGGEFVTTCDGYYAIGEVRHV
jgi:hypothetical protein